MLIVTPLKAIVFWARKGQWGSVRFELWTLWMHCTRFRWPTTDEYKAMAMRRQP